MRRTLKTCLAARVAGLILIAVTGLAPTARAQQPLPSVLERVAPSIVRVRVDEEWGSGFLYPSARHVTTSYALVNRDATAQVVLPDGFVSEGRVVAWSASDDLVILELERAAGGPALSLTTEPAFAGLEVVMLGYPRRTNQEEQERLVPRPYPTPRFARVSLAGPRALAIDVDWLWTGDVGAPVINWAGEVVGVVSEPREKRRGAIDAASATALSLLAERVGQQGAFEADPPVETSWFGGLFVTPVHTERLYGAGVWAGYRYGSLVATLMDSFRRSGFTPTAANTFEARDEFAVEAYASFDVSLTTNTDLSLGPGGALVFATERSRRALETSVEEDEEHRLLARPLLLAQLVSGRLMLSVTLELVEPSLRMDLGVAFGR